MLNCLHTLCGVPSLSDVFCGVIVGPPLTQSSLINNRDQPGTSAVPSLAPVGPRLPPPLPQNLLYTVSERKHIPFFTFCLRYTVWNSSVDVWLEMIICLPPVHTNLKGSLMAFLVDSPSSAVTLWSSSSPAAVWEAPFGCHMLKAVRSLNKKGISSSSSCLVDYQ